MWKVDNIIIGWDYIVIGMLQIPGFHRILKYISEQVSEQFGLAVAPLGPTTEK